MIDFDDPPAAEFSPCRTWRYVLRVASYGRRPRADWPPKIENEP